METPLSGAGQWHKVTVSSVLRFLAINTNLHKALTGEHIYVFYEQVGACKSED